MEEDHCKLNLDLIQQYHSTPGTIRMLSTLENLFSTHFLDQNTSDVILKVGNRNFHAHRIILGCWSPYFQNRLACLYDSGISSQDIHHGEVPTIVLENVTETINGHFESFLEFLYSGRIILDEASIWQIVDLATTFGIPVLNELCSDFLTDLAVKMTTETDLLQSMVHCKRRSMVAEYISFKERLQFINRADMPPCSLQTDTFASSFQAYFNDEATSDVSVVVGDKTYHLHSLILSSRSETLKEILSTDIKESGEPIIIAKDIVGESVDIFKAILKFFYTDEINLSFETVWHVASIAEKLQERSLSQMCTEFAMEMSSFIPINGDLVRYFHQADTLQMSEVKDLYFQIILANFSFFTPDILPDMDLQLLCLVLEQSDLVVDNEYTLYKLIQSKIAKLHESGESENIDKILNLIRFDQMTAVQLKMAMEKYEDYFNNREEFIVNCLAYISSLWEHHKALESPDPAIKYECTLYDLVEPIDAKFKETDYVYMYREQHILKVVRFDQATANQLKEMMDHNENNYEDHIEYVATCVRHMYSIWEQHAINAKSLEKGGPRKYLKSPQPHFEEDSQRHTSPNNKEETHTKIDSTATKTDRMYDSILHQGSHNGHYTILGSYFEISNKYMAGPKYDTVTVTINLQDEVCNSQGEMFPLLFTAVMLIVRDDDLVIALQMKTIPILCNLEEDRTFIHKGPLTFSFYLPSDANANHVKFHIFTRPLPSLQLE